MVSGMLERLKNNYLVQAWLVIILALWFGASLAGVQLTLGPTIEANKTNETLEKVPELVVGRVEAEKMVRNNQPLIITPHSMSIEKQGKKYHYSVYETRFPDGKQAGWVVKTTGQGYADKIELLIGFDSLAENITGLFVLDQKETPGLGNKIISSEWRDQFINKDTNRNLVAKKRGAKAPNEIDAITGATVSSKSVCIIINKTVSDLRNQLATKALKDEKK
jgi:electron transport complex protein RnfG